MPKFNRAFYLSFMGEINGREQNIPNVISYFYEKDNNHIAFKENTTIDFATDKRRKLIQNSVDMPICCINFPYDPNMEYRYRDKLLNIDSQKTNREIAEKILKKFLSQVVPYSVIYVEIHGKPPSQLVQKILVNDSYTLETSVSAMNFTEKVLVPYIPVEARNNLKIHLIVCRGGKKINEEIMDTLHLHNFTKTCVVGYETADVNTLFPSGENLILTNIYLDSSSKMVAHNYNGNVIVEEYKEFKKNCLLPALEENDKIKVSQLIIFVDLLREEIVKYNEYNSSQNVGYFHWSHRHGKSGRSRADLFSKNLGEIKNKIIPEICVRCDDRVASYYEKKIIFEIKDLVTKQGEYGRNHGRININNNSLLTYILRGFKTFLLNMGIDLQLNVLKCFAKYLSGNAHSLILTNDNVAERNSIKTKIINLPRETVNKW